MFIHYAHSPPTLFFVFRVESGADPVSFDAALRLLGADAVVDVRSADGNRLVGLAVSVGAEWTQAALDEAAATLVAAFGDAGVRVSIVDPASSALSHSLAACLGGALVR